MFIDPAMSIDPTSGRSMSAVLRTDRVRVAGQTVDHRHVDPVGVLHVRDVLGRELRLGAAHRGVLDQDRLEVGLRDVDGQARRRQLVVGLAVGTGPPRADASDLLTGDGRAEDRVSDQAVLGGVREHLVVDVHVAEDLHGPLVRDVRAWRVGGPPVLRDHDVGDPQRRQEQRRGRPGRT
jgi:hypothetical protein